jgi:hypothetical protein
MRSEKRFGIVKRQGLASLRFHQSRFVTLAFIPLRPVGQNDVVEGNPHVETAGLVELDEFVDRVRRNALFDVGEGAAVSKDGKPRIAFRKAEEFVGAEPEETLTLGERIATRRLTESIDNPLRNEEPVERGGVEDLVGVEVITLSQAITRPSLRLEVEARINEILAVREEEPHAADLRSER